jgi:murein DD-endopeptidase MepM/ murein hydrolase activator NlpD
MVRGGPPPLSLSLEMTGFGRHFTVRLASGAAFAALAAGGICLASLFFTLAFLTFRDPVLVYLARSSAAQRAAYEDRIATMRYRIDQLASRQAVDRTTIDATVEDLIGRQARLEMRHAMMASLLRPQDTQATGSIKPTPASPPSPAQPAVATRSNPASSNPPPPKAATPIQPPLDGGFDLRLPSADGLSFGRQPAPPPSSELPSKRAERVDALERKIAAVEMRQTQTLAQLANQGLHQNSVLSSVLADLQLDSAGLHAAHKGDPRAMGGPFIPAQADFETTLAALRAIRAENQRLNGLASSLPLMRPLRDEPEVTSGFGYRRDPFTGQQALHSGLDLKLPPGSAVLATAAGVVVSADYSGGYGNMVEIDHGNGMTTRYGHLSAFLVREGQTVEKGTPVGTIGSSGRSTGPHLHYETRINDEAVDPLRFLRAGERLRRLLDGMRQQG